MTPREMLAQDRFKIEQPLALFGRPLGCLIIGSWQGGACEGVFGLLALEPFDMCRLTAAFRYERGTPLLVARTTEENDARDDTGVLERHFERPLPELLKAIFDPLADAFAEAAELRGERADVPGPHAEPAPTWLH